MTRVGVNIMLMGLLVVGLGGPGYLLPFIVPFGVGGVEIFETAVLVCWGTGAALLVVGAIVSGLGKVAARP